MPTVVYVDVLLFINTIITYAVLITAEKLFKYSAKTFRLIAASFIGSLFSLLLFYGIDSFLFSLLIKAVSSLGVTLIAFSYRSRKEFIKTALGVVGVSVIYSGMMILVYQLFKPPNMIVLNDVVYFEFNPLILILFTAIIYTAVTLFQKLFRERIKSTVVPLSFTIGEHAHSCTAKIDTGCNLTEPFSGSPVIIVDPSVFVPDESLQRRVIPYSTVNGSSLLYGVKADKTIINGDPIDKDVYIAASRLADSDIRAIINSDIVR